MCLTPTRLGYSVNEQLPLQSVGGDSREIICQENAITSSCAPKSMAPKRLPILMVGQLKRPMHLAIYLQNLSRFLPLWSESMDEPVIVLQIVCSIIFIPICILLPAGYVGEKNNEVLTEIEVAEKFICFYVFRKYFRSKRQIYSSRKSLIFTCRKILDIREKFCVVASTAFTAFSVLTYFT